MRKLTLSLAVLAALLPGQGQTLGLGEIELNSALNQELDAEIEVLSAVPEDAEQLIVKLADRDAFARAGIDRPFLLQQLKFKVLVKDDKPYVKVFTKSAIKEPFLSFLVETGIVVKSLRWQSWVSPLIRIHGLSMQRIPQQMCLFHYFSRKLGEFPF